MISDRDVAFYRENGYVVVPGVLEPALVESLRREMSEILDKARGITAHTDVYDLEPGHRPEAPRVRRIKTPHRFLPGFEKLYRNPRLVGIVQKLVGPSVRLLGSKLNMKAPHYGSPVEWHQDWAFYPHTNDDLLAVGVMLDDCSPRERAAPRRAGRAIPAPSGTITPTAISAAPSIRRRIKAEIDRAVPLTGSAGSMSFHHVRLLHGSAQNVSDRPRALLLYEYAAADAWPLMGVKDLADFDARLVTGAPSIVPRVTPAPVRMPLPAAIHQGSIYENQTDASRRYFAITEASEDDPG